MRRIFEKKLWLLVAPLALAMVGCNSGGGGGSGSSSSSNNNSGGNVTPSSNGPKVLSTTPENNATVPLAGNITATFSDAMDQSTINTTTFTLKNGATDVPGEVTYAGKVATFNP